MDKRGENAVRQGGKRLLAALAAAALLTAALICDSRYALQVSEYEIVSAELPAEFDGFRIVHLSDLHGAEFGRDNSRLAEQIKLREPDLIALTGDFAAQPADLEAAEDLLRGIGGIAPIYYVSGNHEWAGNCIAETKALMERYGVTCLENEYELLRRDGAGIVVAGVEDPNGWADMIQPEALAQRLRGDYPAEYVLWLGHRNYWVREYPALPVDLILCGHAHGGIVRLPLIGGLLDVNHRLGAEYEAGLYVSGDYCMEVSRGLGNSIPIPRLFNRPEIAVLTLKAV